MSTESLIINLFPRETECIVCEAPLSDCRQGVPVYEDLLLPNEWTGDWGGFDACQRCFEIQGKLTEPTPLAEVRAKLIAESSTAPPIRPEWASVALRIAWARQHAGLSQGQAAFVLKVERALLRAWEAGEQAPTAAELDLLGDVYAVTTAFLATGETRAPEPDLVAQLGRLSPHDADEVLAFVRTTRGRRPERALYDVR